MISELVLELVSELVSELIPKLIGDPDGCPLTIRPPDHVQYEHEGLRPEQLALDQIRDLIHCVYYTE